MFEPSAIDSKIQFKSNRRLSQGLNARNKHQRIRSKSKSKKNISSTMRSLNNNSNSSNDNSEQEKFIHIENDKSYNSKQHPIKLGETFRISFQNEIINTRKEMTELSKVTPISQPSKQSKPKKIIMAKYLLK